MADAQPRIGLRAVIGAAAGLLCVCGCYASHELGPPEPDAGPPPPRVGARVAAGDHLSCALRSSDSVWCWGERTGRQLVIEPGEPRWLGIAAGWSAVCAYNDNGLVRCASTIGVGERLWPFYVQEITAFENRLCARSPRGEGACGPLNGTPELFTPEGIDIQHLGPAIDHTCAVTTDGRVLCTGSNAFLQLGRVGEDTTEWLQVEGVTGMVEVAPGATHTCARSSRGRVSCWGSNAVGQLGDGRRVHRGTCAEEVDCTPEPVDVEGLSDATAIASGTFHTCALRRNGRVVCWGSNAFGRLGDGVERHGPPCGDTDCSLTPVQVRGLEGITDIAAGRMHNCARAADGRVLCWGSNFGRQLGVADPPWSDTPVMPEVPPES